MTTPLDEFAVNRAKQIAGNLNLADHTHCEHGNFVGDPYGADHMCHPCEMGMGLDELLLQDFQSQFRHARASLESAMWAAASGEPYGKAMEILHRAVDAIAYTGQADS